jgi:hypothetical protein
MTLSTGAIVGYRRSRHNVFGTQARFVLVADGELRVLDADGAVEQQVALADARVELKRGMLEVAVGDQRFFLYGLAGANRVPPALVEVAQRHPVDQSIEHGGSALDGAAAGCALRDVLRAHGATG